MKNTAYSLPLGLMTTMVILTFAVAFIERTNFSFDRRSRAAESGPYATPCTSCAILSYCTDSTMKRYCMPPGNYVSSCYTPCQTPGEKRSCICVTPPCEQTCNTIPGCTSMYSWGSCVKATVSPMPTSTPKPTPTNTPKVSCLLPSLKLVKSCTIVSPATTCQAEFSYVANSKSKEIYYQYEDHYEGGSEQVGEGVLSPPSKGCVGGTFRINLVETQKGSNYNKILLFRSPYTVLRYLTVVCDDPSTGSTECHTITTPPF